MSYNVMVGKGARGRYNKVASVKGEGFAKMHAAMLNRVPGQRAKAVPAN